MHPLVRGALRAIWWGSVAGGGPFLLLTVPLSIAALFDNRPIHLENLLLFPVQASFPIWVTAIIVVPAFVLLALPITVILRRWNVAITPAHGLIGAATGLLIPAAFALLEPGINVLVTASLGTLSGGVTGFVWARALERHNSEAQREPEPGRK